MNLIIWSISIIVIVISIIIDIKRIKSNKELIRKYNEVLISHKELGKKLDLKKEIDKEIHEKIENKRKNFEMLKDNLTFDYDYLAEEVINRIKKRKINEVLGN